MKHFLMLLASLVTFTLSAQNQIATLSHEGAITTKYGADAFKTLYDSSVDGDIITLSSGSFKAPAELKKNITVRGAGMGIAMSNGYSEPTIISGYSAAKIEEYNSDFTLTIEGVIFNEQFDIYNSKNLQIAKCKFKNLRFIANYSGMEVSNCYLMHSLIEDLYSTGNVYPKIVNCVVKKFSDDYNNYRDDPRDVFFLNSIVETVHNFGWGDRFQNCIIVYSGTDNANFSNQGNTNNLLIGKNDGNPFPNCDEGHPNYIMPNGCKTFIDNTFYQLTDEAKAYKGTDGSELGIYGGPYVFSAVPSNPQITKFNVAPRTTADGKLSVEIEVSIPQ